jgi:hypothetical protein
MSRALCLLLFLALCACAKAQAPKEATSAPPAAPKLIEHTAPTSTEEKSPVSEDEARDELAALESTISQGLAALGAEESDADGTGAGASKKLSALPKDKPQASDAPNTPKPSPPKLEENACLRSCELVRSICTASEKICKISARVPPGSKAPARCEKAQKACEKARPYAAPCGCR